MPISESFCKRGQFAYLKSCSLKVRLLIQHTCRGPTATLSRPRKTVMPSPWSLTGQLKLASVFLEQVIDTSIRSSWFCSCHPGDAFLDHLANRTCIHRYKETLLNQISLQLSAKREQTEMAIFQFFPERDILAYFNSCCLRVWPLVSLTLDADGTVPFGT